MIRIFRYWLCRLLCGKRLFNSDMSLEIDRLIIKLDHYREINQRLLDENTRLRTQPPKGE